MAAVGRLIPARDCPGKWRGLASDEARQQRAPASPAIVLHMSPVVKQVRFLQQLVAIGSGPEATGSPAMQASGLRRRSGIHRDESKPRTAGARTTPAPPSETEAGTGFGGTHWNSSSPCCSSR